MKRKQRRKDQGIYTKSQPGSAFERDWGWWTVERQSRARIVTAILEHDRM